MAGQCVGEAGEGGGGGGGSPSQLSKPICFFWDDESVELI